jgi:thioredoxin
MKISAEQYDSIFASGLPVFLDVYADWCGPCKAVAPNVAALEEEFKGKIDVFSLDIDSPGGSELADKLKIRSIPTLLIFKGGEVWRHVGYADLTELREAVGKVL